MNDEQRNARFSTRRSRPSSVTASRTGHRHLNDDPRSSRRPRAEQQRRTGRRRCSRRSDWTRRSTPGRAVVRHIGELPSPRWRWPAPSPEAGPIGRWRVRRACRDEGPPQPGATRACRRRRRCDGQRKLSTVTSGGEDEHLYRWVGPGDVDGCRHAGGVAPPGDGRMSRRRSEPPKRTPATRWPRKAERSDGTTCEPGVP